MSLQHARSSRRAASLLGYCPRPTQAKILRTLFCVIELTRFILSGTVSSREMFLLGTHHPDWLEKTSAPLFISRRALTEYRRLPKRPDGVWALDSGGFTEISMHGRWMTSAREYAADVQRFSEQIGSMLWAAPQDWMCEPEMIRKTGLNVEEHQRRTVQSVLELRALGANVIPVLQGWSLGQYYDCWDMYEEAGINLLEEKVVGLGSVCRRQSMMSASHIVTYLSMDGLKLHGFGFKVTGLKACASMLESSDSLAWSLNARMNDPLPECVGKHKKCNNCMAYALQWREELLNTIERSKTS